MNKIYVIKNIDKEQEKIKLASETATAYLSKTADYPTIENDEMMQIMRKWNNYFKIVTRGNGKMKTTFFQPMYENGCICPVVCLKCNDICSDHKTFNYCPCWNENDFENLREYINRNRKLWDQQREE